MVEKGNPKCWNCDNHLPFRSEAHYIKGDTGSLFCSEECLRTDHNDICIRTLEIDESYFENKDNKGAK